MLMRNAIDFVARRPGRPNEWPDRTVRATRNPPEDVRQPGFIFLRLIAELVLLPFRLAVGLAWLVIGLGGALGVIAWTIQLLIGGSGDGTVSPGLMWLACVVAVPAGFTLHALATAGVPDDPTPARRADTACTRRQVVGAEAMGAARPGRTRLPTLGLPRLVKSPPARSTTTPPRSTNPRPRAGLSLRACAVSPV